MAVGLDRSELRTRLGLAEGVTFPRVLGIEATGVVDLDPSGTLAPGEQVMTMMGGMGRVFDGGYAQYTCVPAAQVIPFNSLLDWAVLGAVPEMLQIAYGSLTVGLDAQPGQTLLVRGGTSSVGTPTLPDTLAAVRVHGVVCFTGMLSNEWIVKDFYPIGYLPRGVRLTAYGGDADDLPAPVLQSFLDDVAAGRAVIPIGRVFALDEIREAHALMESGDARGKLVVLPWPDERSSPWRSRTTWQRSPRGPSCARWSRHRRRWTDGRCCASR
jgi:NADPH2:quinone reductase